MNAALQFDFTVNKVNNTVEVTRAFAAGIDLVWAAWTQPELLDQWWAPKPYQTRTKFMDFRVGGYWLYAMVGPEGIPHWCRADYDHVETLKSFGGLDAFCDENGMVNLEFPRSRWDSQFTQNGQTTTVSIVVTYQQLSDLEKIIEMGFKEGFTAALGNLDDLLATQQAKH
jgi:uncharacterized protein YndB with AHSA1/START domain